MRRAFLVAALLALAACSQQKAPGQLNPEASKLLRDSHAATLTKQLESINYQATVTHQNAQVNIRVGQASVSDIRRAICQQRGWPNADGKMVRLDDTLRFLRAAGITSVSVIGDAETLDVAIGQDGRCLKAQ